MLHRLFHKLGFGRCPRCETLVDYALDGLGEGQQEKVRKHLVECPPCREQVRDYWQVREGLGLCCPERDVPEGFNRKVLERLREEPEQAVRFEVRSLPLGSWARFWMSLGPVFAVLSLMMTGVAAAALLSRHSAPAGPGDLATLSTAILSDPRAATVTLTSTDPGAGNGAKAVLVLCPGMDHAVLRCQGLARCPENSNYALWMRAAGGPARRLGRFEVDGGKACEHLLTLDKGFDATGDLDFRVQMEGAAAGGPQLQGSVKL